MWDETTSSLLDALPVGVLLLDEEGVLLGANRKGLDLLELDPDVLGTPGLPELIRDDTLKAALSTSSGGIVRTSITEGDNAIEAEVRPYGNNGSTGKLLLLRDVSGQAGVALLRRNLVFDVLHKVRTPLTTIRSVLSLAANNRLDPSRLDLREILGMGANEAERLVEILARLKDLFLVETGELLSEINVDPTDVGALVRKVTDRLGQRFAKQGHRLAVEVPDEPLPVLADRRFLERALEFIGENAFQYTPPGEGIRFHAFRSGESVEIRVEDEGVGIPYEELPFVFDRFRRIDSGGVRPAEGEGLGLYLARSFLLAQNATVLLDSRRGTGTVVEVVFAAGEEGA